MKEETHLFLEFDYPLGNEFLEITPFLIGVGNTNGMGREGLTQYLRKHNTIEGVRLVQLAMGPVGIPFLAPSQLVPTKNAFTNMTGKFYWNGQEEEAMLDHKRKLEFERTALITKLKNYLPLMQEGNEKRRVEYSIEVHEKMLAEELESIIPVKNPIYSTIYIKFERRLEKSEIQFIHNRAIEYLAENELPCELKQTRIERVIIEEESLVPSLGFVKEAILPSSNKYIGLPNEVVDTELPDNLMELNAFIQSLELGIIKNSDFEVKNICSNSGVLLSEEISPSDILYNKKYLIDYQSQNGTLKLSLINKK